MLFYLSLLELGISVLMPGMVQFIVLLEKATFELYKICSLYSNYSRLESMVRLHLSGHYILLVSVHA